jgi:hypothetical protein
LPGANTLAYLALSSAMKKKSFITLTPGCRWCLSCRDGTEKQTFQLDNFFYKFIIYQVALNKSSLLLKIILQNMQTLQLN